MHRHRAAALIDRAEAHGGAGDLDAACNDAFIALDLVAQVQHVGNLARIEGVAARAAKSWAAHHLHHEIQLVRADYGLPIRWGSS